MGWMDTEAATAPKRACPNTGRVRGSALAAGATRPSDALTAFLAVGVAWLVAAALTALLAALTDEPDLRWLALHLAFLGGVSQMVVGAAQFFTCAFLATDPASRPTVRLELALWNAAVVATAIGVPLEITPLTGIGGALVLAGLAVFVRTLLRMRRRSLQTAPWATRWYLTCAAFLAVGALLGPVMDGDVAWTHGSLLGAHVVLNLGGWFGTAIVGTLHTFYPSLTGTRLRWARLQLPTYLAWCAGIALLAASAAFNLDGGAAAGWALLLAAAAMLAANLLASARAGTVRTPGALLVSAGQLMLLAAVALGLASAIENGPLAALLGGDRTAVAALLVGGWIGLTVAGSLMHLLTVMARVRRGPGNRAAVRFESIAVAGAAIAVAGVVLVALGDATEDAGRLVAFAGYALVLGRVAALAVEALRAGRLEL